MTSASNFDLEGGLLEVFTDFDVQETQRQDAINNEQGLFWMPSFDCFSFHEEQQGQQQQFQEEEEDFESVSETESVCSQNTRTDFLQLNAANEWIQEKRFRPAIAIEESFIPEFSEAGYAFLPSFRANQKPLEFPQISMPHKVPSALAVTLSDRVKKEHPSSNTATLKKRQGLTTSKFNGVCWNKRKKKWRARLSNKGTREFLGDFDTEEDAARAFDKRIKQLMAPTKYADKLNFKEE